jgi:NAD(P)-dependent dehydrogenase (short-subunit alcohol dehydrogenase family)
MTTTAVVTGAGRGLGRLIAERLADRGHLVVLTDIDETAAHAAAKAIGRGASAMVHDVRDALRHREVAAAAVAKAPLAVWVNNAGVLAVGPAWEQSEDAIRRQVEVNLLGVIWGCRAAIDAMHGGRGHLLNIASMSSLVPAPGLAAYGATKHAVLGYTLSLAGELRRAGMPIAISAICPDAIETDMVRGVENHADASLLFSSGELLKAEDVADETIALLDRPRLIRTIPAARAAMVHMFRPFPEVGLRLLEQFYKIGAKRRRRRVGAAG